MWPWRSGVLDPQGPVAAAERTILLNSTTIMLAVIVPIMIATIAIAWWFRAGNPRAVRLLDWSYSGRIELVVWSIPTMIVIFLGGIAWIGSHDLDPRRAMASKDDPTTIQVVSLDWKWLFIYPDKGVASVNRLIVPAGAPLRFELTSATVMNSFFVPQLGSQIYTMPRMVTQLNLQADRPGRYPGFSTQFSGDGFSNMRFDVVAVSKDEFSHWVETTHAGGGSLDEAAYADLAKPGVVREPKTFGSVAKNLFGSVANGQPIASNGPSEQQPANPAPHEGG